MDEKRDDDARGAEPRARPGDGSRRPRVPARRGHRRSRARPGPTAGLSTKYGHDRVLDTPISEAAIVGAAIGAAIDGMLPVAEIMIMDFIGIAADQLINNAAKMRFMTAGRTTAPITVRTQVYGGLATGARIRSRSRPGSCTSPG